MMKPQTKQQRNRKRDGTPMSQVFYAWDVERPRATGFSCRFPYEYVPVAMVDCDDLEEIFWLFNFSEEFFEIPMLGRFGLNTRCLTIGDVVMLPDGRTWICGPSYWSPIAHGESHLYENYSIGLLDFGKPAWEV